MSGQGTAQLLGSTSLLELLTPDALERLARTAVRREYAAGDALFLTGDSGRHVFVIVSGRVRAVQRGSGGSELVLHTARAGEIAGSTEIADEGARTADAIALDDVVAIQLTAKAVRTELLACPAALLRLTEELLFIVRTLGRAAGDLATLSLSARLAKSLLEMPAPNGKVVLEVSQGEMAQRLGAARQSLSRALRDLQSQGLITVAAGGREIAIRDRQGLAAAAGGHA